MKYTVAHQRDLVLYKVNARPRTPRPRALSTDRSPILIRMAVDMLILINDFFTVLVRPKNIDDLEN